MSDFSFRTTLVGFQNYLPSIARVFLENVLCRVACEESTQNLNSIPLVDPILPIGCPWKNGTCGKIVTSFTTFHPAKKLLGFPVCYNMHGNSWKADVITGATRHARC